MFGAATRDLAAWLAATCPQAEISLDPPTAGERTGATVHAFLVGVRSGEGHSDRRSTVAEALLRYAVATDGTPAEEAHEMLGEIFAAATAETSIRVVPDGLPLEVWIAHGTAPRPCLQVEVPVRVERAIEHRWTVEHPLRVQVTVDGEPAGGRDPIEASHARSTE